MEILDQKALRAAQEPTIRRIRGQAEACHNSKIARMLRHISVHLLSPELNVNRLKEACSIRDNSVAIHFHSAIGVPPHEFISLARMEIAKRLLTSSDWRVFRISDALGFSSIQVFSRSFQRREGCRPTVFRRKSRQGEFAVPEFLEADEPDQLRRLLAGEGTSVDVLRCIVQLIASNEADDSPEVFRVISLVASEYEHKLAAEGVSP